MSDKSFFGKLIEAIGGFLKHLLDGAKKGFNNLPKEQQDAVIQGVNIAQIIKTGYAQGEDYVLGQIGSVLGVSPDVAKGIVLGIGKDLGLDTDKVDEVLSEIADQAQVAVTSNGWNGLWQNIAKFGASWASSGKLDWVTLSLGVIEFAFQKFVKAPLPVKIESGDPPPGSSNPPPPKP